MPDYLVHLPSEPPPSDGGPEDGAWWRTWQRTAYNNHMSILASRILRGIGLAPRSSLSVTLMSHHARKQREAA